MAYVSVPKDFTKVKTKVLFGLTLRQLLCFGCGALLGVPLYFWLKEPIGVSAASMCMIVVMVPFFMLAMYEKNGQPLEKVVGYMIRTLFTRPKVRPYKTKNYYSLLMRQEQLKEEVDDIVHGKSKKGQKRKQIKQGGRETD